MYPSKYCSADFVFVKMLIDEFARQGNECVVMCPFSTLHYKHWSEGKEEYYVDGNKVTVLRPNFISIGDRKIGSFNISTFVHKVAVRRALKKMKFEPDAVYCHFWKQGIEAYPYSKKKNLPLFVATGEAEILVGNKDEKMNDFRDYVKGVICVSSKNKTESLDLNLTTADKCYVVPNSIDNNLFKKLDKTECRKKLGLPQDKFIIAFVGWFENRKGSLRVSCAIDGIEENDVYSLFIGAGQENPDCENILFKGKLQHDDVPVYLNAADVFVLPTLAEGCCNAVVEAMACGLPIVSSNLPFNWDVLNNKNSIMVDPMSVEEIRCAIVKLRDDKVLRESMSKEALETAKELTISKRATKILNVMKSNM